MMKNKCEKEKGERKRKKDKEKLRAMSKREVNE